MKPSSIKKVFGIISYFPDNDSAYHIETRRERSRRFKELLAKLEELWPNVDIMVIAQNWQDFEMPNLKNKTIIYRYEQKLGILGARRELRKQFLASEYDYLIMLDDDALLSVSDPQAVLEEIDSHPDGFLVIQKRPSPLVFCAISKYIYSKVDMPDVVAEKSQGFEDDIFTATCFAKFPDSCGLFPKDLIKEYSFHYDGPGKCPSTWAREKTYNWDYMRKHTREVVAALETVTAKDEVLPTYTGTPTIDLIISYVNNSDQNWIRDYIRTTKTHNPTAERFRSWGTLKYLLRGIEKYMPFVRNVVLLVARQSQIPIWINQQNVRVVLHEEFIPKEFLPTFNSCTIESFFWNIPDLADRIIYFNDDMFPLRPMSESEFFTGDVPHIKYIDYREYTTRNMYDSQCRSGIDLITHALALPSLAPGTMFRPWHMSTAISRQSMDFIKEHCADSIKKTVSVVRHPKNVNQYIYAYYSYFTDAYIDNAPTFKYDQIQDKDLSSIVDAIIHADIQLYCLNDSGNVKEYAKARDKLIRAFEMKFPNKSKYELW